MTQSTVTISIDDQREKYHKALIMKIAEFTKYLGSLDAGALKSLSSAQDVKRLLCEANSFKNLFEIRTCVITLTRDDVDLLTRILDTSA